VLLCHDICAPSGVVVHPIGNSNWPLARGSRSNSFDDHLANVCNLNLHCEAFRPPPLLSVTQCRITENH
jgi:hypothetical protein